MVRPVTIGTPVRYQIRARLVTAWAETGFTVRRIRTVAARPRDCSVCRTAHEVTAPGVPTLGPFHVRVQVQWTVSKAPPQ
jgi:hypothetical protein